MTLKELERAALDLDLEARTELTARLLESLEEPKREENDRIWLAEAARRDAELEDSGSEGILLDSALRELRRPG